VDGGEDGGRLRLDCRSILVQGDSYEICTGTEEKPGLYLKQSLPKQFR